MIGKLERHGYIILNRKTTCPQLWDGCDRLCGQQLFRTDDTHIFQPGVAQQLSIAGIRNGEFILNIIYNFSTYACGKADQNKYYLLTQ